MRLVALLLVFCGLIGCSSSPDIRGRNADARAWAESEQRDEAARKKQGTLPRTSKELSRLGDKVAAHDLKPGDLVFFNTRRFAFSHVGIYLGDNRFIHAPRSGGEVEIVTLSGSYWQMRFNGARRLVGVVPDLIPTAIAQTPAATAPAESSPAAVAEPPGGDGLH